MTSAWHQPPRIEPGRLIAAIPALLRFHPTDSVVVIGFSTTPQLLVRCVLRLDIPTGTQIPAVAEQLSAAVLAQEIDLVAVVIIADGGPGTNLPHPAVQRELVRAFTDAHVEVADAVWVARIEPGIPWRSYLDVSRVGTLPDPSASLAAAVIVLGGSPFYASRADLVAHLAPDPAPLLARRAARLAVLPAVQPEPGAGLLGSVLDRIAAEPTGEVVLEEDTLVRAAHALTHPLVRQAALGYTLTDLAQPAQRLWTILTRATPRPAVANPASLLATAVYLAGDGALANIALDVALAADPAHPLARAVRACLDYTMPPDQFRQLLTDSVEAVDRDASADSRAAAGSTIRGDRVIDA